jgi:plastocyanin
MMSRFHVLAACIGCILLSLVFWGCPYTGPHYPVVYGVPSATVVITSYTYNPAAVTITHGGTVIWTNNDPTPHSVYLDDGGGTCALNMQITATGSAGATISHTFPNAGTYQAHCQYHSSCGTTSCTACPGEAGTVIVQ